MEDRICVEISSPTDGELLSVATGPVEDAGQVMALAWHMLPWAVERKQDLFNQYGVDDCPVLVFFEKGE